MRIAVLGMGNMGRALALRLLERGHDVTIWNRTPGKAAEVVAAGAKEMATPANAAHNATVVALILADDNAVRQVTDGPGGVLDALGSTAVLVNHSTISVPLARELAERGPRGRVIDAPVLASPLNVRSGEGQILTGGDEATVEKLTAYWTDISGKHVHCGPSGSAATMKIVSNLLLLTGLAVVSEAIVTAQQNGISDEFLRSFLNESAGVSASARPRLDNLMARNEHPGWFSTTLGRKDVDLARDLAADGGATLRVAATVSDMYTDVIENGRADDDVAAIVEAVRPQEAGVSSTGSRSSS